VTTRCNARCTDRCNIWACEPYDMPLEDAKFAIDALANSNFSVLYLTGGETGIYPHIVEAVEYGRQKGLITSLTSNGTIPAATLKQLRKSLDFLSISVDNYDGARWDQAKHLPGISKQAIQTIKTAKAYGIKLYGITFLNPSWTVDDVERIVHYVNDELGISFALSYPYISSNDSTFSVGGKLSRSQNQAYRNVRNMVAKVLEMKLEGADIANVSGYMKDVLRAHDELPMKYPCMAGKTIVTIDCTLNVFPCYKRPKLFNLRDRQDLNLPQQDTSQCDNKSCLINCFKEASLASRHAVLAAVTEELSSHPKFYAKILKNS
jgi:MoaA/NifB/PqqE/SkfB family radical SAM enzyme